MLCENCHKNQASVHTVAIIDGKKQEHYLCSECAKKGVQYSLPSLMNLLSGLGAMQQPEVDTCGCCSSFPKFQKTGLLGCPGCYTAYRELLLPVIKRAQGGRSRHVGRRPVEYDEILREAAKVTEHVDPRLTKEEECLRLRKELNDAVKEELYERAAELRDRLRSLEGGKNA